MKDSLSSIISPCHAQNQIVVDILLLSPPVDSERPSINDVAKELPAVVLALVATGMGRGIVLAVVLVLAASLLALNDQKKQEMLSRCGCQKCQRGQIDHY